MKTHLSLLSATLLFCSFAVHAAEMNKVGTLFTPVLEWSLDNPDYDGNPFDLVASATFTHTASAEQRTVGMFYAGSTVWKFRFSGTQLGDWTFTTASDDPDLSGHSGTVTIEPNPDKDAFGFVTTVPAPGLAKASQSPGAGGAWHVGNKWARYNSSGDLQTFVPHFRMGFEKSNFNWSSSEIDGWLDTWMGDEGFNGVFVFMAGYWVNRDGDSKFENRDPDTRSFDVLEEMINKVRNRGGVTHIWYCGDCARKQCVQAGFSDNGAATEGEKKLLRYIGSRLGPVPGWIMGYGYDLPEHVSTSELRGWGNYLRDNMAYDHMLGARDQGGNINYSLWPEADFYSRGHWFGGQSYSDIVGVLNSNSNKAHSNDERWYDSRLGNEENLRRQMWDCNIAGGMSAIFGHDGGWKMDPYSNPHYFKTCITFWKDRLFPSMQPDNDLTDGYCLITSDESRAIFYKENTDKIRMNLSGFNGKLSAVAVDAKKNYKELPVSISQSDMTWGAPYSSDWAVAVGEGDAPQPPPEDDTPPSAPSNLNASAVGKSQIDLSWDAASDGESGVDSYKIYRNGEGIGTSSNTSYSDEGLNEGTEYTYRVSAVNGEGMEGDKSDEAAATTGLDQDPPQLASIVAQSETSVKVVFNEPVTQASAEETSNYQISGGITVSGASLESDQTSVMLTTSALTLGTTYTLTVSNISDKASTPNTGGDQMEFSFSGELTITNLTVASGKTYEIVENIAEGDKRYIDREYTLESVDDLAGMHYIRTANNDANAEDENFLSFDVSRPVTVYVAYRHGTDLPSWLSSWEQTGDEVCGDECSDVYKEDFDAGTVTLGGNKPGGAGNMYVVFVTPQGGATGSFTAPDLSIDAVPRVRVFSGGLLRVSGLYPQMEYTITLTDTRGRVSSVQRIAGARGTVSLPTAHRAHGVYALEVRSRQHVFTTTTVLP